MQEARKQQESEKKEKQEKRKERKQEKFDAALGEGVSFFNNESEDIEDDDILLPAKPKKQDLSKLEKEVRHSQLSELSEHEEDPPAKSAKKKKIVTRKSQQVDETELV